MKTVILYGELAKRYGKYHRFAVRNAAEAISALKANFKDFTSYMAGAHLDGVGFKIFVGNRGLREYEEISNPCGASEIIRIAPAMIGSGGFVRILIGAALVVGGLVLGSPFLAQVGAALIIGGVATLLSGTPKTPGSPEQGAEKSSYIFNGATNTDVQGAAVPLVYGEMIVGSKIISAGIEAHEEA